MLLPALGASGSSVRDQAANHHKDDLMLKRDTSFARMLKGTAAVAAVVGLTGIASIGGAMAATDGTLGGTSTGTSSLTVNVPLRALITGVADLNFSSALTTWNGADDVTLTDSVCVFTSGGAYEVTASGSGAANAFTVTDGSTLVSYTVEWDDAAGASSGTALSTGVQSSANFAGTTTLSDCTPTPTNNATFIVTMNGSSGSNDLASATTGANYTGTLTLLVTPE